MDRGHGGGIPRPFRHTRRRRRSTGRGFHYLIGAALGVLFGAAVTRIPALRLGSVKKGVGLGILYTEIISLPILVLPLEPSR